MKTFKTENFTIWVDENDDGTLNLEVGAHEGFSFVKDYTTCCENAIIVVAVKEE